MSDKFTCKECGQELESAETKHTHGDCMTYKAKQFMSKEECEECQVHTAVRMRREVGEYIEEECYLKDGLFQLEEKTVKALKKGVMPE